MCAYFFLASLADQQFYDFSLNKSSQTYLGPGNTKEGSITVRLTSCLTGLDQSVLQMKTKIVSCHIADSKPIKQEVNGTVFPVWDTYSHLGLYRKTYYGSNVQISVISQSVCPWQAFPAQCSVCGQGRSLPYGRSTLGQVPRLTHKQQTRLKRLAISKHSSLLRKSVNYDCNKFYDIGPWQKRAAGVPIKMSYHLGLQTQPCKNLGANMVSVTNFTNA